MDKDTSHRPLNPYTWFQRKVHVLDATMASRKEGVFLVRGVVKTVFWRLALSRGQDPKPIP